MPIYEYRCLECGKVFSLLFLRSADANGQEPCSAYKERVELSLLLFWERIFKVASTGSGAVPRVTHRATEASRLPCRHAFTLGLGIGAFGEVRFLTHWERGPRRAVADQASRMSTFPSARLGRTARSHRTGHQAKTSVRLPGWRPALYLPRRQQC